MNINGRADHIEDYLITVRTGQWFGWTDSSNKIYANLVVHDGGSKPTESDCTNGLTALQTAWDLENDSYKSLRRAEYDSLVNQLDMLYKDIVAGKLDTTGTWATHIKAVKDANPKPS
tara:strand:+ start:800 stop:1150 length:351 start_codon:yes stop_codon:yes gene_type:complete